MSLVKIPKSLNKMSLLEQEAFLVKKLQELYSTEDNIKRMLGKVRGGNKVNIQTEPDRPDEILLKNAE
jgi:hypothetical protein